MSEERVAIILGAGATRAEAMRKPDARRPPLDRGFFSQAIRARVIGLGPVSKYMRDHYNESLDDPARDSLERVMAILYTDLFGGDLEHEAYSALRTLTQIFVRRLAETTNDIPIHSKRRLYRLIIGFLNKGVLPANITLITFNQDIQAEKTLDAIRETQLRAKQTVFSFPGCYRLPRPVRVTGPVGGDTNVFDANEQGEDGIAVLKLHGSLNWYSRHNSSAPSRKRLFDPARQIAITTRKEINPSMTLELPDRSTLKFTVPIVIPPVVHKSGILHNDLKPVWTLAEERLGAADRVVIFGYSCPPNDWESANLVCRAIRRERRRSEVSVIDPDPRALLRYVELGGLEAVNYYASASAYLGAE